MTDPSVKPWHQSKTIWFNLLMTVLDIFSIFEARALFDPSLMALIHGIGNVILRVYFTDTGIKK